MRPTRDALQIVGASMGKNVWLSSVLTGAIVFVALQFVPSSIGSNRYALIAGAIAFVGSAIARRVGNA